MEVAFHNGGGIPRDLQTCLKLGRAGWQLTTRQHFTVLTSHGLVSRQQAVVDDRKCHSGLHS